MSAQKLKPRQVVWARRWMTMVLIGLIVFMIGIQPDLIGMNRSPAVGFIQIGVWLTGLAMLLIGAYAAVRVVRNGRPNSLWADIGLRLIATGYVIAATSSLADFIGLGAHHMPDVWFGPLQTFGLLLGIVTCLGGILMYWPRGQGDKPAETKDNNSAQMPAKA
jgi:hypothetical protein